MVVISEETGQISLAHRGLLHRGLRPDDLEARTEQFVERYADRLAYWVSEPDRGQSHGINKGLARTTGDIIGWLNSDDTLLPGAVSRVAAAMDEGPTVVTGATQLIDEAGNVIVRPRLAKRAGREPSAEQIGSVVKEALAINAAAIILAHNHPSGVAEPSQADERITRRLRSALELVDIRLLDHLIIGAGRATSMASRGLL